MNRPAEPVTAAHLRYEAGQLRAIELRLGAMRPGRPAITTAIEGLRAQRLRLQVEAERMEERA